MRPHPGPDARDSALAQLLLSTAWLALEGASLGLGSWELAQGSALSAYAAHNAREGIAFGAALPCLCAGALALPLVGWLLGRRRGQPAAALHTLCRRCAPLSLWAFLPPLFHVQPWDEHPLPFLVLVSILAVGARRAFTLALELEPRSAPPAPGAASRVRALAARLRSSQRAPLALVLAAAAGYALFFGTVTVQNHHNLGTNSFDLGIFDNLFWNASHGFDPALPASPFGGPHTRHLGQHATLIVLVLTPIYALVPRAETLLWLQAVLVGFAALPLYLFAARRVGAWIACGVACAYLLYPPVHGPNLYDFHFLMLAPFFLWTSLYLFEARHDRLAALFVILSLLVREDAAVGVAMIGAFAIAERERPLAGLLLCVLGTVYTLVIKLVIMPAGAQSGSFIELYQGLLPYGGKGLGAVLQTVVANPSFALGTLLSRTKLVYALEIAAPLAFLPWIRPIGWLCSIPGTFFCLLVTSAQPLHEISFQYTPHWTTYLFMALVANLQALAPERDGRRDARQRGALVALALAMTLCSHQFGAILQHGTARAGYNRFDFGTTPAQRTDYRDLRALIAEVPADAPIVASERIVPHVSNRRDAYTLRIGAYNARYLLSEIRGLLPEERRKLNKLLRSGRFGVSEVRGNFVLAQRGHDRKRNLAVLSRVR